MWRVPHGNGARMVKRRLLFVCLGNICRSPMAEGAFRRAAAEEGVLDHFEIDSAGLGDWHVGQAPDDRAQKAAGQRGIDISGQSARQISREDFSRFDLLLAMDGSNYDDLAELAPTNAKHKIFGEAEGFDHALDLIEEAARGLLAELLGEKGIAKKGN
jgi:protein-tyrosine phosphatase